MMICSVCCFLGTRSDEKPCVNCVHRHNLKDYFSFDYRKVFDILDKRSEE